MCRDFTAMDPRYGSRMDQESQCVMIGAGVEGESLGATRRRGRRAVDLRRGGHRVFEESDEWDQVARHGLDDCGPGTRQRSHPLVPLEALRRNYMAKVAVWSATVTCG